MAADDGSSALEYLAEHDFHFAVIDMLLPGESGFRVLSEYKSRTQGGGRAVMISGNGSDDHQRYAEALGADLFLVKPIAVEHLLEAARGHLTFHAEPVASEP
jgi:DNA-binding response OmpR family regulator